MHLPLAPLFRAVGLSAALFLTADTAGALPLISQMLADNGLPPSTTQFIGLTRWDIPAATLALPARTTRHASRAGSSNETDSPGCRR